MKRIAKILDREGSIVITKNDNGVVLQIRFCSNNHEDLIFISKKLNVPLRKTLIGQSTLTLWSSTIRDVLPEVVPLMENKYRKEKARLVLKAADILMDVKNTESCHKQIDKVIKEFKKTRANEIKGE